MFTNLTIIPCSEDIYIAVKKARKLLGDVSNKKSQNKEYLMTKYRFATWKNINLECNRINKVTPTCRGGSTGLKLELRDVDTTDILEELFNVFGEEILIDFIKNG